MIRLDTVGDFIELDVSECVTMRAQVELVSGSFSTTVLGILASVAVSDGAFYELSSSYRLSAEGASTTSISCDGFCRARLQVITAGSSGALGLGSLMAYSPIGQGRLPSLGPPSTVAESAAMRQQGNASFSPAGAIPGADSTMRGTFTPGP
jgi:hypothetical protein